MVMEVRFGEGRKGHPSLEDIELINQLDDLVSNLENISRG